MQKNSNKKRKERAKIKQLELCCIRTRFPLRNSFDDFISGLCSLCSSLKVRALANFGSFIFPRYVVVLFLCVRILQKCRFFLALATVAMQLGRARPSIFQKIAKKLRYFRLTPDLAHRK